MEGVPEWLTKWTCYIVKYILFEEQMYPEVFQKEFPNLSNEALRLDAKNIRDGKVQNVAITLDKVKHVLERMLITTPPLRALNKQEVYERLWKSTDSIRTQLAEIFNAIEKTEDVEDAIQFLLAVDSDEIHD